jgi:beta-lactamase regulating signal transducer with metallopeptidase domain
MITLLICSATMSAIALLYMAAAPFLSKRYSERGRYYAWLIIMVGLIIPFRPQWGNAIVSVELPASTPPPFVQVNGEMFGHFYQPTALPYSPSIESPAFSVTALNINWWQLGFAVWLAGMLVVLTYQGIRNYRFVKMARRWSESITDEQALSLFQSLKSEMGITRRIPLELCPFAGSPMMIGLLKPRILLPSVELAQDELSFILRHERVHYKRKDLLYKYLVLFATAVHWFNPVEYLVAKAIKALCEMSCDAEVIGRADMDTRQSYSETIIGVVRCQTRLCTALSTNFYGGKKGMKPKLFIFK